jgi:hypothetical protein
MIVTVTKDDQEYELEFPDDMAQDQIKAAIDSNFGQSQKQPKEQSVLQKIDAAITPDALAQSPTFQRAAQFASGVIEGAAAVPAIPFDLFRAAGQAVGVPQKYLPYGSEKINEVLQDTGVTQPPQDVGSISRVAGNFVGGAMIPLPLPKGAPANSVVNKTVKQATLENSGKAGYTVPRSNTEQGIIARALTNIGERFGGKQAIEATAQIKNQPVTNKLAAKALGLQDEAPITPELLNEIRSEAGKAYEAVKSIGAVNADKGYADALKEITKKFSGASKDFPELASKEVENLVKGMTKKVISGEGAVEQVKYLRELAKGNSRSALSSERQIGKAQKAAADALDDLIERSLIRTTRSTQLLQDYKIARQTIAKTYAVEKALNPSTGNVSGASLSKQLSKGVPLSGELKQAASFAQAFPRLAREPIGGPASGGMLEPLVYGTAGGMGTGGIGIFAAGVPIIGKPIARHLMTTIPKQPTSTKNLINSFSIQRGLMGTGIAIDQNQKRNMRGY